jgi:hypothetical protein
MDRYARQRMLAGVGDRGQAHIAAATFGVASDAAAAIERDYLERAGAEHFEPLEQPLATFPHAAAFRHRAARDFAEGTWRALEQLRAAALEKSP